MWTSHVKTFLDPIFSKKIFTVTLNSTLNFVISIIPTFVVNLKNIAYCRHYHLL